MFNYGSRSTGQLPPPQANGLSATSTAPIQFLPPGRATSLVTNVFTPLGNESGIKGTDDGSLSQITKQVADWDSQMDNIDKAQEQLLNDQWKLLRMQIGSLMSALAEVKSEVNDLKDNTLPKDVGQIISNLLGSHDDHGQTQAGLMERVQYLENFVGESADRHLKLISDASGEHTDHKAVFSDHMQEFSGHKANMETRLEYLESMIGDTADKHSKELEGAVGRLNDLHAAVQECAQLEHQATMEQRVNFIEKFMGESADKHDIHKVTMETRLEFIEGTIGDNADKHASEILDAKGRVGSLEGAIKLCAKHEHASSLETRMNFLEKMLGEGADMHETHAAHRTTMETRLEFLEALIGDNADKHATELEAATDRVGGLEEAIETCAKHDHATSIEGRCHYLETCLGESADRHDMHKVNMEGRLEYLEALLGDCADKHSKEILDAQGKLKDLHAAVASCAKSEHHASLETRMEYLESLLGDSADKHEKAAIAVKDLHGKFSGDGALRDQKHKTLEERLESLEQQHGDSSETHGRKMVALEACHQKLQRSHDDAHAKMRDTLGKMDAQDGSVDNLRGLMEQRIDAIDRVIADAAGQKFVELTKDVEKRLQYVQEDQKRARDVLESALLEQIHLEHSLHDESNRQMKDIWDREMRARMSYQEQFNDLIGQERSGREAVEVILGERMQHFEKMLSNETQRIWVAMDKHTHEGTKPAEPQILQKQTVYEVAAPVIEVLPPQLLSAVPPQLLSPSASQRRLSPSPSQLSFVEPLVGTQKVQMPGMHPQTVMTSPMSPHSVTRMKSPDTVTRKTLGAGVRGHNASTGHLHSPPVPVNHGLMSARSTIGSTARPKERSRATISHTQL